MITRRVIDSAVLLLCIAGIFLVHRISVQVFDTLPHLEDEYAYVWQAKAATRMQLSVASPPCPTCFLAPFVVDHEGVRSGKYPPAWPVMLSLGERFHGRDWVNPILAGISLWLAYLLFAKFLPRPLAAIGTILLVSSPFFLLNASSLLSHVWSLFLTLAFIHLWFDLTEQRLHLSRALTSVLIGSLLGLLVLTRPLTALAISLPFVVHAGILFLRQKTLRSSLVIVAGTSLVFVGLFLVWQFAVTGSPFTNPYTLWWPYDKLGFGPGTGVTPEGHSLANAWHNFKTSFRAGRSDLFGWGIFSWIFMPLGFFALRKDRKALLIAGLIPSLILAYGFYWIGSELYGPRYYFEALIPAALLTVGGVQFLALKLVELLGKKTALSVHFAMLILILAPLLGYNLVRYLPDRLASMKAELKENRSQLVPFYTDDFTAKTPALIIVHQVQNWREYGVLTELQTPFLETPFVFIYSRQPEDDAAVIAAFPERSVWHYYADEPEKLYSSLR